MKQISIAFCGIGGYGDYCLSLLLDYVNSDCYKLVGVADPFAETAPRAALLKEMGVPFYDTVEQLYAEQKVDALYIASPIGFHKHQSEVGMKNGSVVMCEKPLTPLLQDGSALHEMEKSTSLSLGVGFQWSYAKGFLKAKKDILDGRYGKAIRLKSFISWPRDDSYYSGYTAGWKGCVRSRDDGSWIMDSVVTNATAHHLHNIFFMLGDEMNTSAMPVSAKASIGRGKPIESFDTCVLKGEFASGAEFMYISTHSGDRLIEPILEYEFENGRIALDINSPSPRLTGFLKNGEIVDYGDIYSEQSDSAKVQALIDTVMEKKPLTCTVETVIPHLTLCNAMYDQLEIYNFPDELVVRNSEDSGYMVTNISDQLKKCWDKNQTPYEAGLIWAAEEENLLLDGYTAFSGARYIPVK